MPNEKILKNKILSEDLVPGFSRDAARIDEIAPAGWLFVHRYTWSGPVHLVNRYPYEWAEVYQNRHYAAGDPVFMWLSLHTLLRNTRSTRWSELSKIGDPRKIMDKARKHGLNYGAALSYKMPGYNELTFMSAARSDREMTTQEIGRLRYILIKWTKKIQISTERITPEEIETLELMVKGLDQNEISEALELSRSAVKKRLTSVMNKLNVKSRTAAVAEAVARKLI